MTNCNIPRLVATLRNRKRTLTDVSMWAGRYLLKKQEDIIVPRSLSNKWARKGGREDERKKDAFCLSSFLFPWSLARRAPQQSVTLRIRSQQKCNAPEEETGEEVEVP